MIHLVYLAEPRFGGWVSYTVHLAKALQQEGEQFSIFKLGNRFEARLRPFGCGLGYQNVPLAGLCELARSSQMLLVAVGPKFAEAAAALLEAGASVCVHDPTELSAGMLQALKQSRRPIITIRPRNQERLKQEGFESRYIPHPYVRHFEDVGAGGRKWNAVALSRLDWDKHTEIIAEANKTLGPNEAVRIYGSENTMYTHHKVEPVDVEWRRNYHGRYPAEWDAAAKLAREAKFMVDMSVIVGDGDGTQYTFLEAWDAGAVLVVNKKWIVRGDGEVNSSTAVSVANAAELAEVLQRREGFEQMRLAAQAQLTSHASAVVVPQYRDILSAA